MDLIEFQDHPTDDELVRFWSKVNVPEDRSGCWLWTGATSFSGHGRIRWRKRLYVAHRYSYYIHHRSIPPMILDHLCDTPACVNPGHLVPSTIKYNTLRGKAPSAVNAAKRYCIHGHALRGDNLYVNLTTGKRSCRECARLRDLQRHARRYAAEKLLKTNDSEPIAGKLNMEIVQEIRHRYVTEHISQRALAREYCVSQVLISKIIRNEIWREQNDGKRAGEKG